MIATDAATGRCVVWFGRPTDEERECLLQAGWHTRIAELQARDGVGVRNGDTVVAFADLRHDDPAIMHAVERLMDERPLLPWLVFGAPQTKTRTPVVRRILQASAASFAPPLDMRRLVDTLELMDGRQLPAAAAEIPGIIGRSPAMRVAMSGLRRYAPVELPVLITGETGTGKEVAARALHDLSARRTQPFAAINCGALPPNLVQSELFGHERGSFTGANSRHIGHFEAASGGTVFLDEVGDLPPDAQTSLLRLLQEGMLVRVGSTKAIKLDVRVLAATHVDLETAVAQGRFRDDLYYRLNVLRLRMPALREREDDVERLAQHFLDAFREKHECVAHGFSTEARLALRCFAWPGNVRELLNRVQRAAVVAEKALITATDLDLQHAARVVQGRRVEVAQSLPPVTREAMETCLRASRYNVSECARRMRVSRVTIYRWCRKYGLSPEQWRYEVSEA